jgi:hypothetical protein
MGFRIQRARVSMRDRGDYGMPQRLHLLTLLIVGCIGWSTGCFHFGYQSLSGVEKAVLRDPGQVEIAKSPSPEMDATLTALLKAGVDEQEVARARDSALIILGSHQPSSSVSLHPAKGPFGNSIGKSEVLAFTREADGTIGWRALVSGASGKVFYGRSMSVGGSKEEVIANASRGLGFAERQERLTIATRTELLPASGSRYEPGGRQSYVAESYYPVVVRTPWSNVASTTIETYRTRGETAWQYWIAPGLVATLLGGLGHAAHAGTGFTVAFGVGLGLDLLCLVDMVLPTHTSSEQTLLFPRLPEGTPPPSALTQPR